MRTLETLLWVLLGTALATSAWLDLEVVWGAVNVPIADLAALVAAAVGGTWLLVERSAGGLFGRLRLGPAGVGAQRSAAIALPAPAAYGAFLAVGLVGAVLVADDPGASLKFLVRKSTFTWLVYGGAVAALVVRLGRPRVWHALGLLAALCLALPCIWASLPILARGWASVPAQVPHLTGNHKALAVALAPWLPLLWAARRQAWPALTTAVVAIGLIAVSLSISKNAWLTTGFGLLVLVGFRGRPLGARPWLVLGGAAALATALFALPFLTGNLAMVDAFDSRMSLNLRAVEMFGSSPWVGTGPGTSTLWEMATAPHWRINGVEAHGIVQKVLAEGGVLGLVAYAVFAWTLVTGLWRVGFSARARPLPMERGAAAMGLALMVNILLSTEAFTSSHWAPLAVALGLSRLATSRSGVPGAGIRS